MEFVSTRDADGRLPAVSAAEAIKNGLAPDGGLYMPRRIPTLSRHDFDALISMDYAERAADILGRFLTDYTAEELLEDCRAAYAEERFPGGAAPVVSIGDGICALELWHGPTCAFKDMALQIMPRLLSRALQKTGETRRAMILVATSGDTGKAALEGYRDIPQIGIQVFYPVDGVSRVQKLQMVTQEGDNLTVTAIRGNFDDAQTGVKRIFSDREFEAQLNRQGVFLSSANSINWGRLAPQISYYVSAYCDMVKQGTLSFGEPLDVCVPTGNFGNIFAAYIAKRMGTPIGRLVCASNRNDVLTEFLATGVYNRNRDFYTTISPSMDILISSNLERLLYLMCGPAETSEYMRSLNTTGCYRLSAETHKRISSEFYGISCAEEQTAATIAETFEKHGYLCDTHTAVGLFAARRYPRSAGRPVLLASTASPYKFAMDVCRALGYAAGDPLEALDLLSDRTGLPIPAPLRGIGERAVRFTETIAPADMKDSVLRFTDRLESTEKA